MDASAAPPLAAALWGFAAALLLACTVWAASVPLRDVSIVDIAWGWLVATPGIVVAVLSGTNLRGTAVIVLVAAWALRLSAYIAWRHRGQPEDHRYQAIRARNAPGFAAKSLYLVFGLQAVLAWFVALPVMAATQSAASWHGADAAGFALAVFGLAFEATADAQLARFLANPAQRGRVMRSGLWRYSRHPNYFGEFCFWWGVWMVAAASGAAWTLVSPLVMTVLLLKVSGVALLEKDIGDRRPGYGDYARRTNAFFPWSPRA